jgi:hypothetical protein
LLFFCGLSGRLPPRKPCSGTIICDHFDSTCAQADDLDGFADTCTGSGADFGAAVGGG